MVDLIVPSRKSLKGVNVLNEQDNSDQVFKSKSGDDSEKVRWKAKHT